MNKHVQMKYIIVIIPTSNEARHIHHVFPDMPDFIDEGAIPDGKSNDGTREESLKSPCYGYRAIKREAREKIACGLTGFGVGTELIGMKKAGLKVSEVPDYGVWRKHDTLNINSLWVAYTEYDRTGVYT